MGYLGWCPHLHCGHREYPLGHREYREYPLGTEGSAVTCTAGSTRPRSCSRACTSSAQIRSVAPAQEQTPFGDVLVNHPKWQPDSEGTSTLPLNCQCRSGPVGDGRLDSRAWDSESSSSSRALGTLETRFTGKVSGLRVRVGADTERRARRPDRLPGGLGQSFVLEAGPGLVHSAVTVTT